MPAAAQSVPTPTTSLIGREGEVAEVCGLLEAEEVRLVTLTGIGGVGKTRLAIEVATRAAPSFPDGTPFVSLAGVSDPGLVTPTVARALGIGDDGNRPLLERLIEALAERHTLLVIDNFEHVLEAAPLASDLLAACPALKILATSRAPLRLRGEREFEVPPLPLPAAGGRARAEEVARFPSVALFTERARAASREFELSDENAAAVAEICRSLDGVPLALELAAAGVKLLSPDAIAERVSEHPLEALGTGPRDLPDRQRTLRNTIEWSYGLLEGSERRLLIRMSVFRGGSAIPVAEAVGRAGETEERDVIAGLGKLLDLSLVVREQAASGESRIRLLETIREFALEQLEASGEERVVRNAHASSFRAFAEGAEPKLRTREQQQWLDRLELDHDNFRAALRWAIETEKEELALRLSGALAHFWLMRGYLREGRDWLDRAIALEGEAPAPVRAKALVGAGVLTHYQNDYDRAAQLLTEALELYRDSGDRRGIASALEGLALVVGRHRDPGAAREMYEEALEIARELGDEQEVAFLLERLGTLLWYGGDADAARPLLSESESTAARLGLPIETAHAVQALGWLALSDGDPVRARQLLEEALSQLRKLRDRWAAARAVFGLGLAAVDRGAPSEARERLGQALRIVRDLDDKLVTCGCFGGLAATAVSAGRARRAILLLGAAEGLRRSLGASHSEYVRTGQERALRNARDSLGDEKFVAAWEEGIALDLESAVAVAREEAAERGADAYPDGLTRREVEVLRLVASGATDPDVAEELVLSVRTVHAHLRSVYRKIGVRSRSGATRYAIEKQLV